MPRLSEQTDKLKKIHADLIEQARRSEEEMFSGDGLLTLATRLENVHSVKEALALGVDVNERGASSMTALHLATWQRNLEITTILLTNGADIEALDEDKESPLYSAVAGLDDAPEPYSSRPLLPIIELLLRAGARPDTFSKLFVTPARLTTDGDIKRRLIMAEEDFYKIHPSARPVDADWKALEYENDLLIFLARHNRSIGNHLPHGERK